MAYVYRYLAYDEFDSEIVGTLISSNIFLTSRYNFDIVVNKGAKLKRANKDGSSTSLLIADTEIFQLFQRQRGPLMRWMQEYSSKVSSVMETVIRIVTMNDLKKKKDVEEVQQLHSKKWWTIIC